MFYIFIAAILGFIMGIQTPIQFGFFLVALLVFGVASGATGEGLEGLIIPIIPIIGVVLLLGMLAGDVYVHIFYPESSDIAALFNGIPNPFVPPTNTPAP